MLKNTFKIITLAGATAFFISCGNSSTETTPTTEVDSTEISAVDSSPVVLEGVVVIIDEHKINDIPVTSKGKTLTENTAPETLPAVKEEAKEKPSTEVADNETSSDEEYEVLSLKEINASLLMAEYEADMEAVTIEEAIIPLEETQTLVSYNKKGEKIATLQVISTTGSDEVEQIIFTDKKHKDVYNVQAGMTAKEAKELRKELKHMEHKGDHYLYDDQSNIMYLMDAQNGYGDEVTEVELDQMEISAIIWKDKKHHKKEKEEKK